MQDPDGSCGSAAEQAMRLWGTMPIRFRDANNDNRLDLKCARTSVPGTWLTVSHISGPTLIDAIRNVRMQRARVEGPEQTEQFAQLAAIHQDWWYARVAASPEEVGARVEFVGDLEEGNFHVIAMSSLLARNSEVVPTVALAEMQHDRVVRPAPVGPMALTGNAWLHAAEEVERGSTPRAAEYQIEVRDRTSRELDLRSFSQSQPGTSGHFVDEDRDLARRDRRFARSSSQLTPELFANMVESRWFNETTATIEEVDQTEGRLGQVTTPVPRSEPYQSQAAVHEEQTVEGFLQAPASQPTALAPKQP